MGVSFTKIKEVFQDLQVKIRHSHIPMPVDQYLASAFMYSVMVGIVGGVFGLWLGAENLWRPGFPAQPFRGAYTCRYCRQICVSSCDFSWLCIVSCRFFAVFLMAYLYPYFQANNRQAAIDKSMLPAITFMYALTKGGMSIYDVFRSLSRYTYIFGATAEEISYVCKRCGLSWKGFHKRP